MESFTKTENFLKEQGFIRENGNWFFRDFDDKMEVTIEDGIMTTELTVLFVDGEPVDFNFDLKIK
jgi:hypothetical protein